MLARLNGLLIFIISFTLLNLELVPIRNELKQISSYKLQVSTVYASGSGSGEGSGTGDGTACYDTDEEVKAARARGERGKKCKYGNYEQEKGTWVGVQELVSFLLIVGAAVAMMFLMPACSLAGNCGYATWAAVIGSLVLLTGEIIATVKQNTLYDKIEYNYTQIRSNRTACDSESDSEKEGCGQLAALKGQKEALDGLVGTLLVKAILYIVAAVAFLVAFIIELAANSIDLSWISGVATQLTAAVAMCAPAISAFCASATLGAAGCITSEMGFATPCLTAMTAAAGIMSTLAVDLQSPQSLANSVASCVKIRTPLNTICATATTPPAGGAAVPTCTGTSILRLTACSMMETVTPCFPPAFAAISQAELVIDALRGTPGPGSEVARAASPPPGTPPAPFLPPTVHSILGCAPPTPAAASIDYGKSNELQKYTLFTPDFLETKNLMQDRFSYNVESEDRLVSIFGMVFEKLLSNAQAKETETEENGLANTPWIKVFGFGAAGVALIIGIIVMANRERDFFFTKPIHRATYWWLLFMGSLALMGTAFALRGEIQEEAEKLKKIIDAMTQSPSSVNTSTGPITISTIPPGGFDLTGLDENAGTDPAMPIAPCPFGGDGKNNCLPLGAVDESGLVGTPLVGMGGTSNTLAKIYNNGAGRNGMTLAGLKEGNKLGGALKKLRNRADLMKKAFNDQLKNMGMNGIDFDKRAEDLRAKMYSTAKNNMQAKGIDPKSLGDGMISQKLVDKLPEETKTELSKVPAVVPTGAADPFAGMNFQEEQGAQVDLGDSGAAAMNDLDIKVDDISNNEHASIFESISMRYKKTAYPRLFEEAK